METSSEKMPHNNIQRNKRAEQRMTNDDAYADRRTNHTQPCTHARAGYEPASPILSVLFGKSAKVRAAPTWRWEKWFCQKVVSCSFKDHPRTKLLRGITPEGYAHIATAETWSTTYILLTTLVSTTYLIILWDKLTKSSFVRGNSFYNHVVYIPKNHLVTSCSNSYVLNLFDVMESWISF